MSYNLDAREFALIYNRCFKQVYALCIKRTWHVQNAEDITAEVFAKLWMNREKIQDRPHARKYLLKSAINACVDCYNKKRKSISLDFDIVEQDAENRKQVLTDQQWMEIIDRLPPRRASIIKLRFFNGMKSKKVAKYLGVSEFTVHNHSANGIQRLREIFNNHWELFV